MKELERTKRISISAVLFLLVILIAVLTFKRPQYVFENNSANTLQKISKQNHIITQKDVADLQPSQYTIIDIRSNYEYDKGHINNAINISTHEAFSAHSKNILKNLKDSDKLAILYGAHPDEASSAWMLLYQLGYENVKVLCIETGFVDNKFQIKNAAIEKPKVNYAQVMKNSTAGQSKETKVKTPKKVITKPKKKKRIPEGGC